MMSEFKKFFIGLIIIMAAGIAGIFGLAVSDQVHKTDVVSINDSLETVKENWDDLTALRDKDLKTELLILDSKNKVLFSSSDELFSEIRSSFDAMQKDMLCVAVNRDEKFLGTLILPDPEKVKYDHLIYRIFGITVLNAWILCASYASFFYYINRNIVKPFRRMKRFAGLIAEGKLDEPLILEKNNIFGIFTESFDVMREELKAAKSRELALKLKEKELIASLSHDLKTPVTGIKLICELLEVKTEDGYIKGKIRNISRKTEEINVLVSDLLSSTLEELGELRVNCAEVTSDSIPLMLAEHDVRKKVVADEILDCIVRVDERRLSQVIGNVIVNSYKYADTEIDVIYHFQGKYLVMDLKDYGEGVEPEELYLLTNKFYRGKKNTSGKEGSGLGLYISSELMNKMGGKLICSSDGKGFLVRLLIPLA